MIKLYGIKNCDTVRKARKWLESNDTQHSFHDFRQDGLKESTLNSWVNTLGWEVLLNKRGTTFRQLSDKDKTDINQTKAIKLMLQNPTLIKRPVLEKGKKIIVGFSIDSYKENI